MSYFFYHVVDSTDKIRIGYLEATDVGAVRALFQKASVISIEQVREIEKPDFYGARLLIHFLAVITNTTLKGTVEATSEQHALETLQKEVQHIEVKALSTQHLDSPQNLEEAHKKTALLFAEQAEAEKEEQVPVILEKTRSPIQEESQSTILDYKYKELLLLVTSKLSEIGRDPAYVAIVAEIASVVFIQREKSSTTLKEKYETLHALMREIALIEDELDPTPLKADLREAIERMVPFLQQIEKLQIHIVNHGGEDTRKTKTVDNAYDIKRKKVQELHRELEELQHSSREEDTIDISIKSIFVAELPKLMRWISIAGITTKILADLAFFTVFSERSPNPGNLELFVDTLSTHTFFTKALITFTGIYLLLAIYERFSKKYYIVMLSFLGFLCMLFFLAVTP